MKNIKYKLVLPFLVMAFIFNYSCQKDLPIDDTTDQPITDIGKLKIDESFDWSTTKNVAIHLEARTNNNQPLKKIRMYVYSSNPGEGALNANKASLVYSGFTDDNGVLIGNINLAQHIKKLYVKPMYIGLEEMIEVPIIGGIANHVFGGQLPKSISRSLFQKNSIYKIGEGKVGFLSLGTWTNPGHPSYLTISDVISSALLADINASFPEYDPLPQTHPQYLVAGNEANTVLKDSADIWVTFVHEGAGYKNVLGFYTYQKGHEPNSVNDITNMTIIFPNVSYSGSGGTLNSGAKVYLGSFGANTVIGYFLIANGYNSTNGVISTSAPIYYSNSNLNSETDVTKKQHMVMLKDTDRDLLILGFEDINRGESACDNDFNDAIFYITANPITAIETTDVPEIDTPGDSDDDGISDKFDDFPTNPDKAMNNYYPAENEFGTLAFEDLWPAKGDYDFNDLVLDYQYNQITNGENKIIQVDAKFVVRAIGAGYHNGFGFQMDLLPSDISSVSGLNLKYNYIVLSANNTESGHSKATIIPFDNAFNVLPSSGGTYVNTVIDNAYVVPDTQFVSIVLVSPKTPAQVGSPPYNPFLIANKERGKEVHLPGYMPTVKANSSYFGTDDDNTNLAEGNYYKSKTNLPWGMNLPSSFVYPREKSSIIAGHLKFGNWAQSSGFSYMDWYQDKLGYRQNSHLFIR
jgi:LruC domain-containing protein